MNRKKILDLRLELSDLKEFFQAPDFDPLAEFACRAGRP
jgi:hypothetical protein